MSKRERQVERSLYLYPYNYFVVSFDFSRAPYKSSLSKCISTSCVGARVARKHYSRSFNGISYRCANCLTNLRLPPYTLTQPKVQVIRACSPNIQSNYLIELPTPCNLELFTARRLSSSEPASFLLFFSFFLRHKFDFFHTSHVSGEFMCE